MSKSCGDCTVCCSGALKATILEHEIGNGISCPFVCKTGCIIYETRPENPCKVFKCGWLVHPNIPDYMRPDKSGVILRSFDKGYANILGAQQYSDISDKANIWLKKVADSVDYKFEVVKI
jgi:hypothetical protein